MVSLKLSTSSCQLHTGTIVLVLCKFLVYTYNNTDKRRIIKFVNSLLYLGANNLRMQIQADF